MGSLESNRKRQCPQGRSAQERPSGPRAEENFDGNELNHDAPTREIRHVKAVAVPANSSPLFAAAPIGPGRPGQTPPSMTELLFSVLRFKWTILLVFILVAAPLIAAIWTQVIPEYRARGELRIRPIIPKLVFNTDDNGAIPFYDGFVNTQVSVMRSPDVLNRVLDQQDVKNTQWYKNPSQSLKQRLLGNPVDPPLERLRETLAVQPRRRTEIVDVSFLDASTKDATVIVNTVLDQYIKYVGETSDQMADTLYKQLVETYNSLKFEIKGRQDVLVELRKKLGTAEPQSLIAARRLRLDQMEARLKDLQNRITLMEEATKQTNLDDSNGVAIADAGLRSRLDYSTDPQWRTLNDNIRNIRHRIRTSRMTPQHPDWSRMEEELGFAEESLRLREMQLEQQWQGRSENVASLPPMVPNVNVYLPGQGMAPITSVYNSVEGVTSLEGRLALAKEEKRNLEKEVENERQEFQKLFEMARLFEEETANLQEKRQLFDAFRVRKEQKETERNVPDFTNISILTSAAVPSKPDSDRRVVFTAMVLFMGLGMGGGVAFLRASRNQTIYAPKDMPPTIQAPFLGYIPLTRIKPSLGKSLHDKVQKVRDDKIESVRLVRTALLSQLNSQGCATVLVASAAEGTGKSTFTVLLGKSLAQSGKKVIMIDADLRRMTLSKRFGLAGEPGFMESLRSKSVDQRYIFSTETSGLSILPAGIPNGDGSTFEGMANGAFKACLSQLRRHYDIVLLDSSPILPVADATIISGQVDGTIMVERELVSRRANVVDALARLDSAGGRLMGTVFVGSRESAGYGYGYRYGYGKTQYS